jgi:hypothetical protein
MELVMMMIFLCLIQCFFISTTFRF